MENRDLEYAEQQNIHYFGLDMVHLCKAPHILYRNFAN